MDERLQKARQLLVQMQACCVGIREDGSVFFSKERGIKPLLLWLYEDVDYFRGATVADKVIGKAAALLFAYGGVGALHAQVVSEHALQALQVQAIPIEYAQKVEYIINRTGDGMCPMEKRVLEIHCPGEAYKILSQTIPSK